MIRIIMYFQELVLTGVIGKSKSKNLIVLDSNLVPAGNWYFIGRVLIIINGGAYSLVPTTWCT